MAFCAKTEIRQIETDWRCDALDRERTLLGPALYQGAAFLDEAIEARHLLGIILERADLIGSSRPDDEIYMLLTVNLHEFLLMTGFGSATADMEIDPEGDPLDVREYDAEEDESDEQHVMPSLMAAYGA